MVQDAFAQCIGGLLSVVVQDSQLIISSGSSGVELKSIQAGSYDSIIQESGTHGFVKLGDMYAEEERDILLELHMPALEKLPVGDPPLSTLLQVGCSYKDPVSQEVKQTPVQQVTSCLMFSFRLLGRVRAMEGSPEFPRLPYTNYHVPNLSGLQRATEL